MSNFWAVVTISIIAPFVGGTIGYIVALRVNRKNDRIRESRERQAILEAFWKEEQLRLNPPPKMYSSRLSLNRCNPRDNVNVHQPMKEYKKLHLKNEDHSDALVDHLNQGWEIFREFTGWMIVCKFFEEEKSPLIARLEEILSDPEAEKMTIEEFGLAWNIAYGEYMKVPVPRAVLVDELPPIEKYAEWGEWDACEQHLAQAERNLSK